MTEAEREQGMMRELLWVHGMLRQDLSTIRELAQDIGAGASDEQIRSTVEGLQTRGPLWQLRVNCLRYCSVVHSHHHIEDVALFPAIRAADPERMDPVVDRLESDHRRISALLDQVESSTRELAPEDALARLRLVRSLTELSEHLLEHLAYEEESVGPVLRSWTSWPSA
jgi:hemerythrin HHE cation binding domain-containing protein